MRFITFNEILLIKTFPKKYNGKFKYVRATEYKFLEETLVMIRIFFKNLRIIWVLPNNTDTNCPKIKPPAPPVITPKHNCTPLKPIDFNTLDFATTEYSF